MENEDKKEGKNMHDVTNFLFEVGILSKIPRSGFHFLGTGKQSVSEHISRTIFIGYALASLDKEVDMLKVLKMCLLHDLHESRVTDLNHLTKKYVEAEEEKAMDDLTNALEFGGDMKEILKEYKEKKTKEAILTKDADILEWIISLKEQIDIGNSKAKEFILKAMKRLQTDVAKEIGGEIMKSGSDGWWIEAEKLDQ